MTTVFLGYVYTRVHDGYAPVRFIRIPCDRQLTYWWLSYRYTSICHGDTTSWSLFLIIGFLFPNRLPEKKRLRLYDKRYSHYYKALSLRQFSVTREYNLHKIYLQSVNHRRSMAGQCSFYLVLVPIQLWRYSKKSNLPSL